MALIIEYNAGVLIGKRFSDTRVVPSPLQVCISNNTFCSGEFFSGNCNQLDDYKWWENPEVLDEVDGHVVVAHVKKNICYFASDANNLDTFYYYYKGERFILSDSFWAIVKCVEPEYDDIDISFVRKTMFGGGSIDGSTIIKNLYVLMPSEVGVYDAKTNDLKIRRYRKFRYSSEITDVDDAVERVDNLLQQAMRKIKGNCGDVTYGVGISGGLDSRIIAHYAKQNDMMVKGFNFCIERPRGILRAESIINSQKIANAYRMEFKPIEVEIDDIDSKIEFAIKNDENFIGNSFKYQDSDFLDFDVLLTGGSGMTVGSAYPEQLDIYSKEAVTKAIFDLFSDYVTVVSFSNRARRGLNYVFNTGLEIQEQEETQFYKIFGGRGWKEKTYCEIEEYVNKRFKDGLNSVDVYGDYFINVVGFRNRRGAFESFFGSKRAFSIYVPFCLKETTRWSFDLLRNRAVLNQLIRKKIPYVAGINTESFQVGPAHRGLSTVNKLFTMIEFLLRGNGTAIDQYYFSDGKVINMLLKVLNKRENDWFHSLFEIQSSSISFDILHKEPARILARIWELKVMIDCLEYKKYKEW